MIVSLAGRARRVGDDINADYIITSARKRDTLDESVLARYLLETVDPAFAASVRAGDLLVAGRNFGCGSAMEVAATVILGAGIKAVVAQSFARSFYRNAVNNGLVPIECATSGVAEGDQLAIAVTEKGVTVENRSRGEMLTALPMPAIMLDILGAGGLVPYIRARGSGGFTLRSDQKNH